MNKRRILYGAGVVLLAVLVALVVWQGSFSFGSYEERPQTFTLWSVSILISCRW
ncbi:MAG: hypothetical protein U0Q16_18465 [Bryobacteraceae bacterium]